MKKIQNLTVIILFLLNISVLANANETFYGSANLKEKEYESLLVNGSLKFENLVIRGTTSINGSIKGRGLKSNNLKVNGSVNIEAAKVQTVDISGSFLAKEVEIFGDSYFRGSIDIVNGQLSNMIIYSKNSVIEDTNVSGNIHIKKENNDNKHRPQILELKGNSTVTGDIVFDDKGEIYISDSSKIEGKITNAKIIRK